MEDTFADHAQVKTATEVTQLKNAKFFCFEEGGGHGSCLFVIVFQIAEIMYWYGSCNL